MRQRKAATGITQAGKVAIGSSLKGAMTAKVQQWLDLLITKSPIIE